ncbi:MAG: DnaB-like helicase C-terminal domain-containing protein [Planctomycetota bacterium]
MDPLDNLPTSDRIREFEEAFDRVIPEDLKTGRAPTILDDPPQGEEGDGTEARTLYRPLPETEGYSVFFQDARRLSDHHPGHEAPGFRTGLTPLDATLGGLARGSVTVLTGPPGSGKTSLAKQLLDGALEANATLLGFYFSPGERLADLRLRTLVRLAKTHMLAPPTTGSWRRAQGTAASVQALSALLQKAPWMAREYLIGPEAGRLHLRGLLRLMKRELQEKKAETAVLVVDHLLSASAARQRGGSLEEAALHDMMGLTLLAEHLQGHVIIIYPFVRVPRRSSEGSEKREGPSEILARLGPVAAEAPLVLSLTTGQAAGEGCLTVIKDRFGRTPCPVAVAYDSEHSRFVSSRQETQRRDDTSPSTPAPPVALCPPPGGHGPSPALTIDLKRPPGALPAPAAEPSAGRPSSTTPPSPGRSPLLTPPPGDTDRSPLRPRRPRGAEPPKPRPRPF